MSDTPAGQSPIAPAVPAAAPGVPPAGAPAGAAPAGGAPAGGAPVGSAVPGAPDAAPAGEAAPASDVCPLPLEGLSANFRKHVDPKAPVPLRMMGAKGLVPMGPKEMATALYMLTFDADPGVREAAIKNATSLPDKIASSALRDETAEGLVLDFYARSLAHKPEYLEMIVLNQGASDSTVAAVAAHSNHDRILEIISQNQLRLLRHDGIVRALCLNSATKPSVIDSVTDFCVRSGLILSDIPAFKEARRRVLGGAAFSEEQSAEAAAKRALEEQDAEAKLMQLGAFGTQEGHVNEETRETDTRKMSITQQIMRLSVAKKIEWANKKGNKEVRTILLRDPNKLVQMAVVQSPRITEEEISKLSLSRVLPQEVLMYIYNNRQLTRHYNIKVNLVNNPKVPVAVSMRFLSLLRAAELKALAKNKNIPNALATAARNLSEKKSQ
ncbi:MAG: hypothetical protein JST92_00105 [Deltaproteobacteria bacterium]|nr:hypothetical protein [Deltaproteobacteria bacterium]